MNKPMLRGCLAGLLLALWQGAAAQDGAELYNTRCAACHEQVLANADRPPPQRDALAAMSADSIYRAVMEGAMRLQGAGLSNGQMRSVAEYLTGKPVSDVGLVIAENICPVNPPLRNPALSPQWNGWGSDHRNARAALDAGITADNVGRLRLSWVYGLPGEDQPRAQPAVADGRLFVGNKAGALYAVDAKTGCTYWTFQPSSGIRSAISVGPVNLPDGSDGYGVFFIDLRGRAWAVNAQNGEALWSTVIETHPGVRGTGSVTLHEGYLYVPTSGVLEETGSTGADYGCCTFRGSVSKVDANTGAVLWKTYMLDEPQPRGLSATGVQLYGPAGVGIWSAPTIDPDRGLLYVGTGNAYGEPAPVTSDAIVALRMTDGEIVWANQLTPGDAFISGCSTPGNPNCPEAVGPDYDFSASPILTATASGRELLVVPQKSGMAYALDPNKQGELVWEYRVGEGSASGGFWGMSVADGIAYVAVSGYSNQGSGGIHGINLETGQRAWFTGPQDLLCAGGFGCRATQSAAVTAIPGAVFSGAADGGMRVYSARDGRVLWTFDSNPEFESINGVPAKGGSFDGSGPVIVDGMVYFMSGNCCIVGRPGNALFAFELVP
jgi:polyvinyl alcohol dehydrogenase (cytochrome)